MKTTNGIHNYVLGISNVFDISQKQDYLKFRVKQWNVQTPNYTGTLSPLPLTIENDSLPEISNLEDDIRKDINLRKKCIQNNMNFYFPLYENETIKRDTLTLISNKEKGYPSGTVILTRETNYAQYFAIAKDWQFDLEQQKLINNSIDKTPSLQVPILGLKNSNSSIDDIRIILDTFSDALPSPAKYGMKLLSFVLGKASTDNGPSWDDIKIMVRTIIKEELVNDKIKTVHSNFSALTKWVNDHYLPEKNKSRTKKSKLLGLLDPKIEPFLRNLEQLLEEDYRIPGFVLLLQGINMYLTITQEKISLGGATRDITKIAEDWSQDMLKVWGEVKRDREAKIEVEKHSYSMPAPGGTVVTTVYYIIHDTLTGNKIGDRNGPWTGDGKSSNAKEEAEKRLITYRNEVINELSTNLGNLDKTAQNWRKIWVPK